MTEFANGIPEFIGCSTSSSSLVGMAELRRLAQLKPVTELDQHIALLVSVWQKTSDLFEQLQPRNQPLAYEFAATRLRVEQALSALLLQRELTQQKD
jgi:hypothetical protein